MERNIVKKCLAIGIILLFIATGIIPAIAQNTEKSQPTSRGNWLYVGGSGPGNYTRIQDAINVSSDGDTVFVYDDLSPYYENIIVNKSINLIGENRNSVIIDALENGCVIDVISDYVYVCGFTLQNSGNDESYNCAGVLIYKSNYATITGNILVHNYDGIFCLHSDKVSISDNIIMENRQCGVHFNDCTFSSSYPSGTITDNLIKNNSKFGIEIASSTKINIFKNNITNHDEIGISLFYSGYTNVHNNIIQNNTYGIDAGGGGDDIHHNIIINNQYGVETDTDYNLIRQNNFIENKCHATFSYNRFEHILFMFFPPYLLKNFIRNYWDDQQDFRPKLIKGEIWWEEYVDPWEPGIKKSITWYNYDWIPAITPFIIEV